MARKEKKLLVDEAKRWLRRACVQVRQSIAPKNKKLWSAAAVRRLTQLPEYRRAKTVAGFISFGSEIETNGFIEQAWKDGKNVVIPMCERGFDRPYFALFRSGDRLAQTEQGPLELVEKRGAFPIKTIDFIVVPGLAFDSYLHRLGYGGGVYDRLLAKTPNAAHIGLFFEAQELHRLPVSLHDKALNAVVTEKRVLRHPQH